MHRLSSLKMSNISINPKNGMIFKTVVSHALSATLGPNPRFRPVSAETIFIPTMRLPKVCPSEVSHTICMMRNSGRARNKSAPTELMAAAIDATMNMATSATPSRIFATNRRTLSAHCPRVGAPGLGEVVGCEATAAAVWMFVPQFEQYSASSGFCVPHFAQYISPPYPIIPSPY